jgi:hypothetical protein
MVPTIISLFFAPHLARITLIRKVKAQVSPKRAVCPVTLCKTMMDIIDNTTTMLMSSATIPAAI